MPEELNAKCKDWETQVALCGVRCQLFRACQNLYAVLYLVFPIYEVLAIFTFIMSFALHQLKMTCLKVRHLAKGGAETSYESKWI